MRPESEVLWVDIRDMVFASCSVEESSLKAEAECSSALRRLGVLPLEVRGQAIT